MDQFRVAGYSGGMFEQRGREIVELLEQLIRERTVSYDGAETPETPDGMPGPGEEHRVTSVLDRALRGPGIRLRTFGRNRRPTLLGTVGRGVRGQGRLLVLVHTDTAPSGDLPWRLGEDPFRLWFRGNLLVGRGVAGAKGPLAAAAVAFRRLAADPEAIPGLAVLVAHSAGRHGGAEDVRRLAQQDGLGAGAALVIGSGTGMGRLVVAEKGMVLLKVQLTGHPAPGGTPGLGRSAVYGAAELLVELERSPPWAPNDPLFPSGVTVNAARIEGGQDRGQVARSCQLILDARFPAVLDTERVIQDIGRILRRLARDRGLEPSLSVLARAEANRVPLDHPLIAAVRQEADAEPRGTGTRSVAGLLQEHGIAAVGFSPGGREGFHAPDESITLSELVEFSRTLERIVRRWCSQPEEGG